MPSSRKSAPAREPLDINLDCKEYVLSGDPDKTYSRGDRSISRASRSSSDRSASRRSSMASAVETSWTTTACPSAIAVPIAGNRLGSFIDRSSCAKKRCFVPSKIDSAADFAPELSVPPVSQSTIRVASNASRRLA